MISISEFQSHWNKTKNMTDSDDGGINFGTAELARIALEKITKSHWGSIQSRGDPTPYLFTCDPNFNKGTIPKALAEHIQQERVEFFGKELPVVKDKKMLVCLVKLFQFYEAHLRSYTK